MNFWQLLLGGRVGSELCNTTFVYDTVIGVKRGVGDPVDRYAVRTHPDCEQELVIKHL